MDVSIIIVSFNTKELLGKCLRSVYEYVRLPAHEVIVVDNASSDGSPEMIEEEFPGLILIRNKENIGFAKANNQAMERSTGKYVLLLNSDAVVKEGTIEKLVDFLERHPLAAAAGPKILSSSGALQYQSCFFPSVAYALIVLTGLNALLSEDTKQRWFPRFYWDEDEIREVDFVEGSCFMMRREAIEKIGMLPEEYFLYFEEVEWCYRAKRNGYRVWYVPSAQVTHLGSASPLSGKNELLKQSRTLYYRRNVGRAKGALISVIMICASASNLMRLLLVRSASQERETVIEELKGHVTLLRGLIT